MPPPASEFLKKLSLSVAAVLFGFACIEALLRIYPSLIEPSVLFRFAPGLRQQVAARIGLPTIANRVRIQSSERLDGGPDIYLDAPASLAMRKADAVDRRLGAVEYFKTDANGYCNPEHKGMRTSADIVVLGDSFTWCQGILPEHSNASVLEQLSGLKVYNISIGGIGPFEYMELLRRDGLKLKPKAVVMNIYEGNDVRDIIKFYQFRASAKNRAEARDEPAANRDPAQAVFPSSYAWAFLKAALEEQIEAIHLMLKQPDDVLNFRYRIKSEGRTFLMNVNNGDLDEVVSARHAAEGKIPPTIYEPSLKFFRMIADTYGFVPIVGYIPSAYTAYADSVTFEDKSVGELVRQHSWKQRQWLAADSRKLNMNFVDTVPAFRNAAKQGPLTHFPANRHLTPAGHRVVAEALHERLRQLHGQPAPDGGQPRY